MIYIQKILDDIYSENIWFHGLNLQIIEKSWDVTPVTEDGQTNGKWKIGQCSGRPETAKEGHNLGLPLIPCLKKQKSYSSPSAAVFCHHVYYGLKVFNACMETGERLSKKCSGCICYSSCFILVLVRLDICPKLYTTGVSGKKIYTLKGVDFDYFY